MPSIRRCVILSQQMLTSKERVLCSLNWQEPDRVPVNTYLTPEIDALIRRHFSGRDPLDVFEVDLRGIPGPAFHGKMRPPQNGISYGLWGEGYIRVQNPVGGTYDEAADVPLAALQSMDDFRNYPWWPNADDFDYSGIADQCDALQDYAVCCGGAGAPDIVNGVSRCRGMEQVLIDIITRDEVGMAIIDQRCDFFYEHYRRILEAGRGKIDILCTGEDMGNQNGRMVSARDFDEVFRPRLQRFIDLGHHYGARVMMHSCGDTHELMPTFIEMGLDVLDAMQPEPKGMQPEKIRELCRGKLAFCGLISTQQTLPYGSEEDCRREARHRLDTIARGGGYIFSPAHCIQPDTPLRNILATYEEALGKRLEPTSSA